MWVIFIKCLQSAGVTVSRRLFKQHNGQGHSFAVGTFTILILNLQKFFHIWFWQFNFLISSQNFVFKSNQFFFYRSSINIIILISLTAARAVRRYYSSGARSGGGTLKLSLSARAAHGKVSFPILYNIDYMTPIPYVLLQHLYAAIFVINFF